jgi:AcrR family transcriptional regulator
MKNNRRTQAARSAATRDALVAAGRSLFATDGFAAVGAEAIVQAAGLTRGALYHHFADKTELFAAVFEAVEADVIADIATTVAAANPTDPIEAMRLGARRWLVACAEPDVCRIAVLDGPAVLGWGRWRAIGEKYGMALTRSLLEDAMAAGRIVRQPVGPLAHVLLGAVRESALYVADAADQETARAEVGAALDGVIVALATEPSP